MPFADWEVICRQILQVERAVRGERQLLDDEAPAQVPSRSSSQSARAPA